MRLMNSSTSKSKYLLLGCGGHGRVVLDTALCLGLVVAGILDKALSIQSTVRDIPVLGTDEALGSLHPKDYLLLNGIGVIPGALVRQQIFIDAQNKGYSFPALIHPGAILSTLCTLDEGVQIMAGAVLQPNVVIGANSIINTRASIDHDCHLGQHVFIGPGAILCGAVRVLDAAFIGAGAIILPGITIGANAIIGAGTVVRDNVAPGAKVVSKEKAPL